MGIWRAKREGEKKRERKGEKKRGRREEEEEEEERYGNYFCMELVWNAMVLYGIVCMDSLFHF